MDTLTKTERKALNKEDWERKSQAEEKKKWIERTAFWTVIICLLLLAFWVVNNITGNSMQKQSKIILPALNDTEISYGTTSATVTIVEFADFQCPACAMQENNIKKIKNEYRDKVRLIYRFFPLTTIHANGLNSARAAYAAYKQNKFWEMHDILFERQKIWENISHPTETFRNYAKEIGLDLIQYDTDYSSDKSKAFIEQQQQQALNIGISSTPTFFINGKQILNNPQNYEEFKELIDTELER